MKGAWGSKRILEVTLSHHQFALHANLGGLAAPESGRSMTASGMNPEGFLVISLL